MKSEQDTILDVAKSQCDDVTRYLEKEGSILFDVITKQAMRQKAEYSRLHD